MEGDPPMRFVLILIALMPACFATSAHARDIFNAGMIHLQMVLLAEIKNCPHVQRRENRILLSRSATPEEDERATGRKAEFDITFLAWPESRRPLIYISHLLAKDHSSQCGREAVVFTNGGVLEVGTYDRCQDKARRTADSYGFDRDKRLRFGHQHVPFWLNRLQVNMKEIVAIAKMCKK
jgi:hypothetical protein